MKVESRKKWLCLLPIMITCIVLSMFVIILGSEVGEKNFDGYEYRMVSATAKTSENNILLMTAEKESIVLNEYVYYSVTEEGKEVFLADTDDETLLMIKLILNAEQSQLPQEFSNLKNKNVLHIMIQSEENVLTSYYAAASFEVIENIKKNVIHDVDELKKESLKSGPNRYMNFISNSPRVNVINSDTNYYKLTQNNQHDITILTEEILDIYTDEDEFICDCGKEDKILSLQQYDFNNHALLSNLNANNVFKDNDIIRIIPKELFWNVGKYIYMGKDYGFFVNTYVDPTTANNIDENKIENYSEAFVFDFTIDYNRSARELRYRVEPVFQANYYTLGKYNFSGNWIYPDDCKLILMSNVIAKPTYMMDEVTFTLNMYNEQQKNHFNNNYDINQDNGVILEQTRCNYKVMQKGTSYYDPIPVIKFGVETGLGIAANYFPPIKVAMEAIDIINKFTASGTAIMEGFKSSDKEIECNNEANIYTNLSRQEQINYGQESFYRTSVVKPSDDNIFLRTVDLNKEVSDYAEMFYVLGDITEATRIQQSISFNIFKEEGKEKKYVNDNMRTVINQENKQIEVNIPFVRLEEKVLFEQENLTLEEQQDKIGYLLAGGQNIFEFEPLYTGEYILDIDNLSLNYQVYYNESTVNGLQSREVIQDKDTLKYALKVGEKYYIKTFLDEKASESVEYTIKMEFSPKTLSPSNNKLNVFSGHYGYIKYIKNEDGIININLVGSGNLEACLLNLDMTEKSSSIFGSDLILSMLAEKGEYYIRVRNLTENELSVTLNTAPGEINANVPSSNLSVDNGRFMKFVPKQTGQYKLKITGNSILRTTLYDDAFMDLSATTSSELILNAQENRTYYIGIQTLKTASEKINLILTFAPSGINYGNNRQLNVSGNNYFSFFIETSAEYSFNLSNPAINLSVLDFTTNPVAGQQINGTTVKVKLLEGEYFIKLSGSGVSDLDILVFADSAAHAEKKNFEMPYNNYMIYGLLTPAYSGSYKIEAVGNVSGMIVFDKNFNMITQVNENKFEFFLNAETNYFVKIKGESNSAYTFEYFFEPQQIYVRRSVYTTSSYYLFESTIATEYKVELIGGDFGNKVYILDNQLVLLHEGNGVYNLQAGKYYIRVVSDLYVHLAINYKNPLAQSDGQAYINITQEGAMEGLEFQNLETQNLKFTSPRTAKYEIRIHLSNNDNYEFEFNHCLNGGETVVMDPKKDVISVGLLETQIIFTMDLEMGENYCFTIKSLMDRTEDDFAFTIVRPAKINTVSYIRTDGYSGAVRYNLYFDGNLESQTGNLAIGTKYTFSATINDCSQAVSGIEFSGSMVNASVAMSGNELTVPATAREGDSIKVTLIVDREEIVFVFTVKKPFNADATVSTASGEYNITFKDENGVALDRIPNGLKVQLNIKETNNLGTVVDTIISTSTKIDLKGIAVFSNFNVYGLVSYQIGSEIIDCNISEKLYAYTAKSWSTVSGSENWILIDVSSADISEYANKTIKVASNVKAINIVGNPTKIYKNISFNIESRSDELVFNLKNIRFSGYNSTAITNNYNTAMLRINCTGVNEIYGENSSNMAIFSTNLTLEGNGSLLTRGGNGHLGSTDYNGGNGGIGIKAESLTINVASLIVYGGNGGSGGNGSNGISNIEAGLAKNGQTGGAGGIAISFTNVEKGKNNSILKIYGGNGGDGGNGGNGSRGNDGSYGGRVGDDGGQGGNGGDFGNGASATNKTISGATTVAGVKGSIGYGGNGGDGGNGGNGQNDISASIKATNGGSGGNGGKGGTGRAEGKMGNGGNGGNGGDAGASGSGKDGGRGGDGYSGGTGGQGGPGNGLFQKGGNGGQGGDGYVKGGRGGNGGKGGTKSSFPGTSGNGGNGGNGYNGANNGYGGVRGDTAGAANGSAGSNGTIQGTKMYPY